MELAIPRSHGNVFTASYYLEISNKKNYLVTRQLKNTCIYHLEK